MILKYLFILFLTIIWKNDDSAAAINNYDRERGGSRNGNEDLKRRQNEYPLIRYSKSEHSAGTHVLNHIQTGSAVIPHHGAKIYVSPDLNKTKSFVTKYNDTSRYNGPSNMSQRYEEENSKGKHGRRTLNKSRRRSTKNCIRCPTEKTVIAQKGLDGVLIELPELKSCRNEKVSKSHYEIETLFGTEFNYLLSQGDHTFIGKILNKKTGVYVQTCFLKYKVIVRQCGRYYPRNRNLKVSCTMGGIYGSKCTFTCANRGRLSHNIPITCEDQSQWIGEEPDCYFNNESVSLPRIKRNHCELPLPPDNSKFSCEINEPTDNIENDLNIGNGSICRIKCNSMYKIPNHLQKFSVFHCQRGEWNSTVTNVCYHL